jgi:asparagine synthase (glutamine-hydrolysing)
MEFAASIPANVKLKGLTSKAVLKSALKSKLPPEIMHRKKMGFGVPLARWFREDLREYAHEILLDEKTLGRGYFKQEAVRRLLDEHVSAAEDHSQRIWVLLNLELWHRIYIDGQQQNTTP